jgi:rhodanese-related sulfurtransferase
MQQHKILHSSRVAVLLAGCAIFAAGPAGAGDPVIPAAPSSPTAAAPLAAQMTPMTQEQLLEHQAKHPGHLYVLDVRTPEEFAAGHVPGAKNVPYDQVAARLAEIPRDKDVVLYCKSGRRAGIAADALAANGYKRLSHLEGDMTAWVANGRPVEQ